MSRYETLDEWLQVQQSVHPRSIDLGLERVTEVARALGVHTARCPVVTVGGTNGKGSVVAHSDALLRAAGLTTGVFTSPHLVRYNERICVNGAEVTDGELVSAFDRIEAARGDTTLTYFEFNTLAALLLFADRRVDVAILEVGLGGRLDAVNLLDADVAVVVSIGLDHRDWLGNSLEDIGREKAGIFRAGRPAVLGSRDMPSSVFEVIESVGAKPVVAGQRFQLGRARERLELSRAFGPPRRAAAFGAGRRHPVSECIHGARGGGVAWVGAAAHERRGQHGSA